MKPFRFGVNVRHTRSRAEWVEKARKIEDLGYSTLTAPDHLTELMAPMPALVSAAEATRHLRVGTYVLNNDFRHPVLVAREAATIDVLTEGRLQLGLGAGSIRSEYEQAGLNFDRGRTRVERLSEAVTIIKGLLSGERVTFSGRHYRVTGHAIAPIPIQKPHPPILIGGNGPRLLALAAREADIVGFSGITFRSGGGGITRPLRVQAIERRRAGSAHTRGCGRGAILSAGAERTGAAGCFDGRSSQGGGGADEPLAAVERRRHSPKPLCSHRDGGLEDLTVRRERWDISYYVVHEPYLDDFAPVVARLAGK